MPPLARLLRYRNPEVIYRFCSVWDAEPAEARRIFADMQRYLWLVAQPGNHTIAPVPIIDEMWHTFLAFTIDYRDWGVTYFGRMLEHVPTTSHEKAAIRRRFAVAGDRAIAEESERMIADVTKVYDAFGEAVVLRWYVAYATEYDVAWFATRRRPPAVPVVAIPPALRRLAGARSRPRKGTARSSRRRTATVA